ncbi:MAG: hypothetical protein COA96_13915 [SAR86 cluster bacterium]|uniref:2TM domain-containing protein n=1 Tax=SAR86 cluster bacterium TaxID=2030880 RepID=A0A2A5ATW3_9GAMM|nr:MAG: hypothetical protein COA96_13915 [SAR86 cluster bacterium]
MADTLKFEKKSSDTVERMSKNKKTSTTREKPQRRYSSDEVADIIRIGLKHESGNPDNTIDHDELISIGKEVGVNVEQIDIAVSLLEEEQKNKDKEKVLWLRFKTHSSVFIGVNLLCIVINLFSGIGNFWSAYVLLGTGIFLLGHYAGLRYAPEFLQMALDHTRHIMIDKNQGAVEDDVNVGFKVADSSGLMESEGLLFIEEGRLVIEHQTVDAVLGIIKTGIKKTEINLGDIVRANLQPKFWSSELVLQGNSLRTFRNLPGNSSGTLYLKINKQSINAALNLIDEISKKK